MGSTNGSIRTRVKARPRTLAIVEAEAVMPSPLAVDSEAVNVFSDPSIVENKPATTPPETPKVASEGKAVEVENAATTPIPLRTLLGGGMLYGSDAAFALLIPMIRDEFPVDGLMETFLVERIVQGMTRLRKAAAAEAEGVFDANLMRYESAVDRTMARALDRLEKHADRRKAEAKEAAATGAASPIPVEDLRPIDPQQLTGGEESALDTRTVPSIDEEARAAEDGWRSRLMFDPTVSQRSPVVRGTWVTAHHIVSLVVDGWTWDDLLRSHPELTEEDVRACLAYNVEEENHEFPA